MGSAYALVAATVAITVYGQLVVKWQADKLGQFPEGSADRLQYLGDFFLNPWIISVVITFAFAVVFWMAAVSKLDLSRAYPLLSVTFILVLLLSGVFLGEDITTLKVVGAVVVVAGLVIGSQG